jgi:hypothetical protein
MKKLLLLSFALTVLNSCKVDADGIINKVGKASGIEFAFNADGTSELTKSYIATLPNNHSSYQKLELMKNAMDKTLKMLPTKKDEGYFDGEANVDRYEWEDATRAVWLKVRYKSEPQEIWLIVFITEK